MNLVDLKHEEDELRRMAARSTYFPTTYAAHADAYRNARRYLELKKQFAPFSMDVDGNHSWCWRGNPSRMKGPTFDAAADRLLEGGE